MRGFSIIELMVTLGVVGTLLGAAYPSVSALAANYRLEGAARNLALTLQKVRLRAVSEGRCFQVSFAAGARTAQVAKKLGASPCGSTGFSNDGAAQAIDDAGRIATSATASAVFDTRGGAETTSVITLTAPNGAVRLVAVNAVGRVNVQ